MKDSVKRLFATVLATVLMFTAVPLGPLAVDAQNDTADVIVQVQFTGDALEAEGESRGKAASGTPFSLSMAFVNNTSENVEISIPLTVSDDRYLEISGLDDNSQLQVGTEATGWVTLTYDAETHSFTGSLEPGKNTNGSVTMLFKAGVTPSGESAAVSAPKILSGYSGNNADLQSLGITTVTSVSENIDWKTDTSVTANGAGATGVAFPAVGDSGNNTQITAATTPNRVVTEGMVYTKEVTITQTVSFHGFEMTSDFTENDVTLPSGTGASVELITDGGSEAGRVTGYKVTWTYTEDEEKELSIPAAPESQFRLSKAVATTGAQSIEITSELSCEPVLEGYDEISKEDNISSASVSSIASVGLDVKSYYDKACETEQLVFTAGETIYYKVTETVSGGGGEYDTNILAFYGPNGGITSPQYESFDIVSVRVDDKEQELKDIVTTDTNNRPTAKVSLDSGNHTLEIIYAVKLNDDSNQIALSSGNYIDAGFQLRSKAGNEWVQRHRVMYVITEEAESELTLEKTSFEGNNSQLTYTLTVKNPTENATYSTIYDSPWPYKVFTLGGVEAPEGSVVEYELADGTKTLEMPAETDQAAEGGKALTRITVYGVRTEAGAQAQVLLTANLREGASTPLTVANGAGGEGFGEIVYNIRLGAELTKVAYSDADCTDEITSTESVEAGDKIYYKIVLTNTMDDADFTLHENFPEGVEIKNALLNGENTEYKAAGGETVFDQVNVPEDGTAVWILECEVTEQAVDAAEAEGRANLTNTAYASVGVEGTDYAQTPNAVSEVTISGMESATVSITKEVARMYRGMTEDSYDEESGRVTLDSFNQAINNNSRQSVIGPGNYVAYQVTVENEAGGTPVPVTEIQDVLPDGMKYVTAITYKNNYLPSSGLFVTSITACQNAPAVFDTKTVTVTESDSSTAETLAILTSEQGYGAEGTVSWKVQPAGSGGDAQDGTFYLEAGHKIVFYVLAKAERVPGASDSYTNAVRVKTPEWVKTAEGTEQDGNVEDGNKWLKSTVSIPAGTFVPSITKTVSAKKASETANPSTSGLPIVGQSDWVKYTVTVSTPSGSGKAYLSDFVLEDVIPEGYSYVEGTAVVAGTDMQFPAGTDGQKVTFSLDRTIRGQLTTNRSISIEYWVKPSSGTQINSYSLNTAKAIFSNAFVQAGDCSSYDLEERSVTAQAISYALGDMGVLIDKTLSYKDDTYEVNGPAAAAGKGDDLSYTLSITPQLADSYALSDISVSDTLPYLGDSRGSGVKVDIEEDADVTIEVGDIQVNRSLYEVTVISNDGLQEPSSLSVVFRDAFVQSYEQALKDHQTITINFPAKVVGGTANINGLNDFTINYKATPNNGSPFDLSIVSGQVAVKIPGTSTDTEGADTSVWIQKETKAADGSSLPALKDGDFKFTIAAEDGAPLPDNTTASYRVSDGKAIFDPISYEQAGTYKYKITENAPDKGWTSDEKTVEVTVVVGQDSITQNLEIEEISYSGGSGSSGNTLTNTYKEPEPAKASIELTKALSGEGNPGLAAMEGKFSFTIEGADDNGKANMPSETTVTNGADGKIIFPEVTYSKAGIYTYTIKENSVDLAGWSGDSKIITAVVSVKEAEGDNKLTAEVTYTESGTFTNTYTPAGAATVVLEATKTVAAATEGGDIPALEEEQFAFQLYEADGTTAVGQPVGNSADGSVLFPGITISDQDMGGASEKTFTYKIKEVQPEDLSYKDTYDQGVITASFTVTRGSDNTLKAGEVIYSKDGGTEGTDNNEFRNLYDAPDPATLTGSTAIRVKKELSGTGAPTLQDDWFGFTLTAGTNTADGNIATPMPVGNGNTATNENGEAVFGDITFTREGEYHYTIKETANNSGDPGISMSDKEVSVTVQVTRDSTQNKLIASVTYTGGDKDDNTFVNTYTKPGSTSAALQVRKEVAPAPGTDAADVPEMKDLAGRFTFTVTAQDSAPLPTDTSAENDGTGTVQFGAASYDAEGTYTYLITETSINGNGAGWTKDTRTVTAQVTVKRNDQNQLVSSVAYSGGTGADSNTFTNIYEKPESTVLTGNTALFVQKAVAGAGAPEVKDLAGRFTFTLEAVAGQDEYGNAVSVPMPTPATAVNDEAGKAVFGDITYSEAGIYKYRITENDVADASWTKDPDSAEVTVTVTRTADNKLSANVVYSKDAEAGNTFTNTYNEADGTTVRLHIVKTLVNTDADAAFTPALRDGQFTFVLTDGEDLELEQTNTGAGADFTVTIPASDFAAAVQKTYVYTITEKKGTDAAVTYDEREISASVTVTKGADNKLTAGAVTYTGGTGNDQNGFENEWTNPDAATVQINAEKLYNGTLKGGDFTFTLIPGAASAEDLTTSPGATEMTAQNDKDGKIAFGPIYFDREGTYNYTISENAGSNPSISYSGTSVNAVVTVTRDPGNNILSAEVSYSGGDGEDKNGFTNVYTEPGAATAVFTASKTLKDQKTQEDVEFADGDFSFRLKDSNGTVLQTKANRDGQVVFDMLTWSEADGMTYPAEYKYTIEEVKGDNPSIIYDDDPVQVTVTVKKGEDPADPNRLTAEVVYSKEGVTEGDRNVFQNIYDQPEASAETNLTVNKQLTGHDLADGQFSFKIEPVGDAPAPGTLTAANGRADGDTAEVSFGPIVFCEDFSKDTTTTKVYEYNITETAGNDSSYTYDSRTVTAKVTVRKDEANKLTVDGIEYSGGEGTDKNTFINSYKKPTETSVNITAQKNLTGDRAGAAAGEYEFVLEPVDGAPMPDNKINIHAKNDADGNIDFGTFTFTEDVGPGEEKTYSYTISEVKGDNPSVTYDDGKISVDVKVTKDADNHLQAEIVYSKDGNAADAAVFENTYTKAADISFELEVTKELTGHELSEGQFSFTMEPVGDAPMPTDGEGTGAASVTVANGADGKAVFPKITVSEDMENFIGNGGQDSYKYQYRITEVKGQDASYAYDRQTVTATVEITKNADNKLEAEVTYANTRLDTDPDGAENVFKNTYTSPDAAVLELTGSKELEGHSIAEGEFTFVLTPQEDAPGTVQRVTNTEDGRFLFDALIFDKDEYPNNEARVTYSYLITEEEGENPSYSYDSVPVTVNITLKKTGADGSSRIEVESVEYLKGEQISDGIKFTNIYTAPEDTEIILEGTKSLQGGDLKDGQFVFTLTPQEGAPGSIQQVKNDADGSIRFAPIPVSESEDTIDWGDGSEEKIFVYQITEVNDGQKNYTYDNSPVTVEVTVEKDEDNSLRVTNTVYEKNGWPVEEIRFENQYTAPESITAAQTGDDSPIAEMAALAGMSFAAAAGTAAFRRRKYRK